MEEIVRYPRCFVCGDENPNGLRARFFWDGETAQTEIVAGEEFEGYRGIYHGGVISSLLDEVMIKAILAHDKFVVTAEMTVRFLHPVRVGDHLTFIGRIRKRRGRVYVTESEARRGDGAVVATATGKYVEPGDQLTADLKRSLET